MGKLPFLYSFLLCFQVLQTALLSCVEELQAALPSEERMLSLPWVHLGYHRFRSRLQNFSRILAVNPRVLKDLEEQSVADPMLARSGMVRFPLHVV